MKRKKKGKRARMTDRLDELCRDIVRLIHKDVCYKCHRAVSGANSHPHHIVAKQKGASQRRFDMLNLVLLCFRCHRLWHDSPTEVIPWYETTKMYQTRDLYLDKYRWGKPAPITDAEMEALIVEYKAKRKELQDEPHLPPERPQIAREATNST